MIQMRCNSFAFNLGRSRLLAPQSSADASVFVTTERRQQKALQVQSVGHDPPEVCGCSKAWEAEGGMLEIFRGIAPHLPNYLALPFFFGCYFFFPDTRPMFSACIWIASNETSCSPSLTFKLVFCEGFTRQFSVCPVGSRVFSPTWYASSLAAPDNTLLN